MRPSLLIALAAFAAAGCQCGQPVDPGTGGGGDNASPTARILSPDDGAALTGAGPFTLTGEGTDPEDGALSGSALVWSSDLDGALGSGGSLSTPLRNGTHRLSLDVTDSRGASGRAQITVTVSNVNAPPVVVIDAPADNAFVDQGTQVSLAGHATDPEDGALTGASLTWTSDKAGVLGTGVDLTFTPNVVGAHRIVLTATDKAGNSAYASITLNVVLPGANKPPVVTISQPANNAQFTVGANVSFTGSATDPEDGALTGAALKWSSSVAGNLGTGASVSTATLAQGTHVITLTATDSDGLSATATITISINAPNNQPPTATITAPANNHTTFFGTAITFTGTGADPEDGALTGAALSWSSSKDGAMGTGASLTVSSLTVGTHQISLTAKDSGNNTGTANIQVTILPQNQAPTVTVTSPNNGASFVAGTQVQLRGSAADPEDGALTGNSLTWRSDKGGVLGTGTSVDTSSLAVGQHVISLTALDSGGRSGSASVTINITQAPVNLAPIARLSGSTQGTPGQTLSFSGATSSDPDGTVVEYSFNFGDGTPAITGTAATASHAWANAGTYTVTLTVRDNQGLTGSTSLTVVITTTTRTPTVVDARADRLGSMCQIAAKAGAVQVGFRNDTHPGLWYGRLASGTFTSELVDGMGFNVGGQVQPTFAMVVDDSGNPHFAYFVASKGLFYATKSANIWTTERVDTTLASPSPGRVSLALNPAASNRPTVIYEHQPSGSYVRMVAAVRTGANTWTNTQLTFSSTPYGQYLAGDVLFDSAGKLYIPHSVVSIGRWDGTTTEHVNLTGTSFDGWASAAWLSAGRMAIVSGDGILDVTVGAPLSATTWQLSLVESFTTSQHAVDADPGGSPHLVVNHGSELELVTVGQGNYWDRLSLGATDNTRIDVAVDPSGQSRVCFFRTGKLVVY